MVNADSFLKDVFYNLLSNACKMATRNRSR